MPGESCVLCNCSGNVDPSEAGHCDSVTGECLRCIGNTDGAHCERCADGFYGDAVAAKNCRGEFMGFEVESITYGHVKFLSIYLQVLESAQPTKYLYLSGSYVTAGYKPRV